MTQHMKERKTFYQRAYNDHSQNAIDRYINRFNIENSINIVKAVSGADELTEEQIIAIKYHAYGVIGLFHEMIFDELNVDVDKLSAFQYEKTPDFLKQAFEQYRYRSEDILNTEK